MALEGIFETSTNCRICYSDALHEIIDLGDQPPANSLYKMGAQAPPGIPLKLMFCKDCGTVQLSGTVDPEFLFNSYFWVTGTSKTAIEHSRRFADLALKHCKTDNPLVIEIASNDGTFLKRFQEKNCRVLGIDPAENLVQLASQSGIPTIPAFFNLDFAKEFVSENAPADIVIARNVIPHVKEIHSVIEGIATVLTPEGVGIIEFHDTKLILEELQYDYIYHEHLFYFTLNSIEHLLRKHGLYIYDLAASPISGGSHIIFFSKTEKIKTQAATLAFEQEKLSKVNELGGWISFRDRVMSHREKLLGLLAGRDKRALAYGASARSSTILNFCQIDHKHVLAIIDKNPLKHGLHTPGSDIPIISYETGASLAKEHDLVLLLAWNFQLEIISDLRKDDYGGKFLIPLSGDPTIV
jgi:SAM-dependent methyltransferase